MFMSIKSGRFLAAAAIAVVASSAALAQDASLMKNSAANSAESPSAAAVEQSRVLYQSQRTMKCSTGSNALCIGQFATLSAKQRIELQHVSCIVQVNGGVAKAAVAFYHPSSGGDFNLPLGLGFQSTTGGETFYTFQQATSMYVPPTKTLFIFIAFGGTTVEVNASCEIFGQFVTLK